MKQTDSITNAILTAAIIGSLKKNNEEALTNGETTNFRDEARKIGNMLYATYLGFQDAGFSPEQAFQLTLAMRD